MSEVSKQQALISILQPELDDILRRLETHALVRPVLQNEQAHQELRDGIGLFLCEGVMQTMADIDVAKVTSSIRRQSASNMLLCEEVIDEFTALILNAFRQPLSLGDSLCTAALSHLQKRLKSPVTSELLSQICTSLASIVDANAAEAPSQKTPQRTAPKVKKKASPAKEPMHPPRSKAHKEEADSQGKSPSSGDALKAPKCDEIVAMASRLAPRMDIDTVREVQAMVSTDFREIMEHARSLGHPAISISEEQKKAIHLMWMLFCNDKGSRKKAEDAVSKRLKKVEPSLALLLYGPEAIREIDSRGLLIASHGDHHGHRKGSGASSNDAYMALDATLKRLQAGIQKTDTSTCGISGLLTATFGEFDYSDLVTQQLANLSPDAKQRLIESIADRLEKENTTSAS